MIGSFAVVASKEWLSSMLAQLVGRRSLPEGSPVGDSLRVSGNAHFDLP